MLSYDERQKKPVTLSGELAGIVWAQIKAARDDAVMRKMKATEDEERLNAILRRLREEGAAEHLPTLEEVSAAWRGE